MKVIKQEDVLGHKINIEVSSNIKGVKVYQYDSFVCVLKENTRELALSICPELAEEIERLKAQIPQSCFYQSDNTTAMNCKNCGRPKFMHNT